MTTATTTITIIPLSLKIAISNNKQQTTMAMDVKYITMDKTINTPPTTNGENKQQ